MTPEERCYKILQDSKYIRVPEENPAESIDWFLKASVGCPWQTPENEIEERMFETNFKNYFKQYSDEILDFAENNPPTFDHSYGKMTKENINLHTMDDQGFEGQVMSDLSYYRWINDSVEERKIKRGNAEKIAEYAKLSDSELEARWQAQCSAIQMYLTGAYKDGISKVEEDRLIGLAKNSQNIQSLVQDEITKRSHCPTCGVRS